MRNRIITAVVIVLIVVAAYYLWRQHEDTIALNGGSVTMTDGTTSNKTLMDEGAVDIDGRPADNNNVNSNGMYTPGGNAKPSPASSTTITRTAATGIPAASVGNSYQPTQVTSLPVNDTLSPNAPNGMAFGGSGKFQWYRQGNITWRINTQSGSSCVAFATMEEWHKQLVFSHGCGNG